MEIPFNAISAEARALAAETALLVKKYGVLEEQVRFFTINYDVLNIFSPITATSKSQNFHVFSYFFRKTWHIIVNVLEEQVIYF